MKGAFKDVDDDDEVAVRCSSWTADGKRIVCAARNAALVSLRHNCCIIKTLTVPARMRVCLFVFRLSDERAL